MTSTFDLDELIRRVLEVSQRVMGSEASNVMLLNEETGHAGVQGGAGRGRWKLKVGFTLKPGQGIAGWVAQHGESGGGAGCYPGQAFLLRG